MKNYRSSIPKEATERVISTYGSNGNKQSVEYSLAGVVVGYRYFREDGVLGTETPRKNGVIHGTCYCFDDDQDGLLRVEFANPYRNGFPHGVAKQWSQDGKLIGTSIMKHGDGLDVWRHRSFSSAQSFFVSEARFIKHGKWHGFEWWIEEDQRTIYQEAHFWEDRQHGIRREWNGAGKLKRGYPQYWVNDERVDRRRYLRACEADANLPRFREVDNLPQREFPIEVRAAIEDTARLMSGAKG